MEGSFHSGLEVLMQPVLTADFSRGDCFGKTLLAGGNMCFGQLRMVQMINHGPAINKFASAA